MAPSRWSALMHRLGLASGGPAPASAARDRAPASRDDRQPAARASADGPSPAPPAPDASSRVSPFRGLVRRERIERHRLDPAGFGGGLRFHGVIIPYIHYAHSNLLLIDDGQSVRSYRPRRGMLEPRPGTVRLHRLVCACRPVSLDDEEELIRVAFPPPDEPPGDDLDLGPVLHQELLRVMPGADIEVVGGVLALLDLLATFEGQGHDELTARRALSSVEGLRRLDALPDRSIDTRPAREALRRTTGGRWSAMIEVDHGHDGHVGGYRREAALGTLSIGPRGWSYERQLVFLDEKEGTPIS